jgi:Na+-translocating ferredoxin:NAD+ oxidoreductase subunit B
LNSGPTLLALLALVAALLVLSRHPARSRSVLKSRIEEELPGTDCGSCGLPDCESFAVEVAAKNLNIDSCPHLKNAVVARLSGDYSLLVSGEERRVAFVACGAGFADTNHKYKYIGPEDCFASTLVSGGYRECEHGCLGFGSCASICPSGAIKIEENGLPFINEFRCSGCGLCAQKCPREVIVMIRHSQAARVRCASTLNGSIVHRMCGVGCLGCGICRKICPFGAITIEMNLSRIDALKCKACGLCAIKCPVGAIRMATMEKKFARVNQDLCDGCTVCAKVCPIGAVNGRIQEKHEIDSGKCIGCGVCVEKCPRAAISIKVVE